MPKKTPRRDGIVYSTDPEFLRNEFSPGFSTLAADKQKLIIFLDTKNRGGKSVTLVKGFSGKEDDLQSLCRKLKTFCGTGGSAKEGEIMIQGDQREKLFQWLQKSGYTATQKR